MQTINVYLPYGTASVVSRLHTILETYGQKRNINFVPHHRPGSDGNIGVSAFLEDRNPDNSLLLTVAGDISRPNATKRYNERDLYPISVIGNTPVYIVANNNVPVNNLTELQQAMRESPDRFSWGMISKTYENHLLNFATLGGIDTSKLVITKFNTGRGANAVTMLMGGHIDLAIAGGTVASTPAQNKQIKILGMIKPAPGFDQYQSFTEMFGKRWPGNDGFGLFVNARTSAANKKYWESFIEEFKADPEVIQLFRTNEIVLVQDPDKKELNDILDKNRKMGVVKISSSELTGRQFQVVSLICQRGLANKQIARELGIGESAVKVHVGSVLKKYGLRDRTHLSVYFNSQV